MAERAVSSTDTIRLIQPQAQVARAKTAVAAFIGRALRGPVNQPVTLRGFEDYQRVFGGLWQPSMLSYALEQYFDNGGEEAIVVRVCNGGRAPTLRLAAARESLTLIGLAPGTREHLRASVDYDGIGSLDDDRFNLVVQRVRAARSELIEEQEIFRRLSIRPGAERAVVDALTESRLVRVFGPTPAVRPDSSVTGAGVGYTWSNADGDDGDPLTHYDIIGDAQRGTGLFALRAAEAFNFLSIPPLSRETDVGLPALLVALRLCRERRAMLLVDPPQSWTDPVAARLGLRSWPFFSEDALMFYPRVTAFDRLRGREERFAPAASAAALIAQATREQSVWSPAAETQLTLRTTLRTGDAINDLDRLRLWQAGVNVLLNGRNPHPPLGMTTLLPEAGSRSEWRYAAARRLALFVMNSIEQGTHWALFEQPGPALWEQLRDQVSDFLEALNQEGAFASTAAEDSYFVLCDQRLNGPGAAGGCVQLVFGFAISKPGDFTTCLVSHAHGGSSARVVSINRYALPWHG